MVEIRQIPMGGRLEAFLDVVDHIYSDDPNYVRPLNFDLGERLNPSKNPFFEHGEGTLFVAYKNGKCVGRISAQIDREHLARYKDDTGFFGFFDTTHDEEVALALLAKAESWLRGKGMKHARGPFSLSINEEAGCLVEGFDSPPFVMMPHHKPYQSDLIERAGYAKVKDLFAWKYEVGELNSRTRRAHQDILAMPEISCRPIDVKDLTREVELVVDIFNDAWSENWGFVPFTRKEVRKMAQDFRLILVPELTKVVSIHGEPAAFAIAIPDLNEMVRDLHGRLFPFGIAKLLYRLKVKGPVQGRLAFLGVRKKWRNVRKYAALSAFLYAEMNESGKKCGIRFGELSWTLEDNGPVNAGIRMMGAQIHKKYRLYGKSIGV